MLREASFTRLLDRAPVERSGHVLRRVDLLANLLIRLANVPLEQLINVCSIVGEHTGEPHSPSILRVVPSETLLPRTLSGQPSRGASRPEPPLDDFTLPEIHSRPEQLEAVLNFIATQPSTTVSSLSDLFEEED